MNYTLSQSFHTLNHWQSAKRGISTPSALCKYDDYRIDGMIINGNVYLFPFQWYEDGYKENQQGSYYGLTNEQADTGDFMTGIKFTYSGATYYFMVLNSVATSTVGEARKWSSITTAESYDISYYEMTIKDRLFYRTGEKKTLTLDKTYTGGMLSLDINRYVYLFIAVGSGMEAVLPSYADGCSDFVWDISWGEPSVERCLLHMGNDFYKEQVKLNKNTRFISVDDDFVYFPGHAGICYEYVYPGYLYTTGSTADNFTYSGGNKIFPAVYQGDNAEDSGQLGNYLYTDDTGDHFQGGAGNTADGAFINGDYTGVNTNPSSTASYRYGFIRRITGINSVDNFTFFK